MKAARDIIVWCLLILCSLTTLGCSKKEEAVVGTDVKIDESTPINEVKAEAQKMNAEQLKAIALKYKEAIETKSAEVEILAKELIQIMLADKSSDRTKTLTDQTDKLNQSIEALTERFEVYYKKLEEKGGDLSGFKM